MPRGGGGQSYSAFPVTSGLASVMGRMRGGPNGGQGREGGRQQLGAGGREGRQIGIELLFPVYLSSCLCFRLTSEETISLYLSLSLSQSKKNRAWEKSFQVMSLSLSLSIIPFVNAKGKTIKSHPTPSSPPLPPRPIPDTTPRSLGISYLPPMIPPTFFPSPSPPPHHLAGHRLLVAEKLGARPFGRRVGFRQEETFFLSRGRWIDG